jgi:hypothetical protein
MGRTRSTKCREGKTSKRASIGLYQYQHNMLSELINETSLQGLTTLMALEGKTLSPEEFGIVLEDLITTLTDEQMLNIFEIVRVSEDITKLYNNIKKAGNVLMYHHGTPAS